MAAHDDKISNNRRKLFKALSAAPVVMTLRPGAALANVSAYQCLAKDTKLDFIPASSAEVCTGENECFAYQLLTYWEVPSGVSQGRAPAGAAASTGADLGWRGDYIGGFNFGGAKALGQATKALGQAAPFDSSCSLWGTTIVEVSSGQFYTLAGDDVSASVAKDGDNLISSSTSGCDFEPLSPLNGYFLVLVQPVDADGNDVSGDSGKAVDIDVAGVYPETLRSGTLQGITQTCLCSIHPDATGTFVSRG